MEPTNYFRMGANFAMSGSRAFQNDSNNPFSLDVQVHQFSYLFNRSTELSAEGDGNFLGAEDFANALYTFDIGQVDLIEEFNASNYNIEKVLQFIPPAISRIKNAMQLIFFQECHDQLIHNLGGGKNFWVHNIGPLGCLPEQLGKRNSNPFELDEYGCLAFMNEAAIKFNSELDILCQQLRLELSHSTIVYVDVYSIKYDLVANSASYGFERPLMACCGYGGPPYNFDWHISCRDAGHNICGDEKPLYISWDGTQYTEAANSIVAAQILSTTYSSPPLDLHFFCA
ncbi:hypothetical protein C2S51_014255 [Perilla frutescens var. frutescens]|nr:hypothetical protein C2S51_014255 [Perilla frutescens var. frutescens]